MKTRTVHVQVTVDDELRRALRRYNDSRSLKDIRSTLTELLRADIEQIQSEMDEDE